MGRGESANSADMASLKVRMSEEITNFATSLNLDATDLTEEVESEEEAASLKDFESGRFDKTPETKRVLLHRAVLTSRLVNGGGLSTQISYLISRVGASEVRERIKRIAEAKTL